MDKPALDALSANFHHWKKTGDLIDQCIDLMLNLRQSGHPGGSRSKVPLLVASTLGAGMRWDVRRPELAFGDRFVLVAGHCCPVVYGMLAVYNEALRLRHEWTGDERFTVPNAEERALYWQELLWLRHNGHLPGHAEMEGNTLFFKFNTGPSGHGAPAALGEAMALKHAGAGEVKVFAMEGEGGHTAGAHHEVKNSAYGLGLDNLIYLFDWNDHGIDAFANSEVMHGTPPDWFESHGWRVSGTEQGESYPDIARALLEIVHADETDGRPGCVWVKTRKGRGYYKYDAPSHGAAHARNSELFWKCRADFQEAYGVTFEGFGDTTDPGEEACREQTRDWFETVFGVMRSDRELVEYLSDTLVGLGESVPERPEGFRLGSKVNLAQDRSWLDVDGLPDELFVEPGSKAPNRKGFATFGAWVNAQAKQHMDRPLVLACSADLADSTNISGFAKDFGDTVGFGWYERNSNPGGCLLPQQITEFTNSGLSVGIATVNMSPSPEEEFVGYWAACSTYGSFSYLKYGLMRLFSQLAQDCPLKVGKVIWVVGHSGPETAEDSRTHFGIFAPGVTQLFPSGSVINQATARGHRDRARHEHDRLRVPALAALPRGRGAQRQDRAGLLLGALPAAGPGLPRKRAVARRLARLDRHHQRLAAQHARLVAPQGGRGVRDVLRLGRPLAHRRERGGAQGRGPHRCGQPLGGYRALRRGPHRAAGPARVLTGLNDPINGPRRGAVSCSRRPAPGRRGRPRRRCRSTSRASSGRRRRRGRRPGP